mgnify:CR=1 FL=1
MNTPNRPVNSHQAYHAHVYYDEDSLHWPRLYLSRYRKNLG